MGRILVVGGSGFIGHRLVGRLGLDDVIATYHHRPFAGGVSFDIATERLADRFLRGKHGITHGILLQGVTNIDRCALHPEETARINVDGTIRAIDDMLAADVKPIFVSSDGIFDGSRGPWTEDDRPCPILAYGRQKAAVEEYLVQQARPWVVARLSKVVSRFADPRNILSEWLDAVFRGDVIRCAHDQILSPADVDDVVDALVLFATGDLSGLYNVCGPRALSRYELLTLLLSFAAAPARAAARIELCSLADLPFIEPRPKNCSMSNRKFVATLGATMRSPEEICKGLCLRYGYNIGLPASAP